MSGFLNDHERPGAVHRRILFVSWFGWWSVFTSLMLFLYLATFYRKELGMDDQAVARVKSLALGFSGLGGLVFGVIGDRVGRKPAMIASLIVCSTGLLLGAAAPNPLVLMIAASMAGFGIGGQWASGQTLVGETVPAARRQRFGTISQSGAPLGLGIATILAFHVAGELGVGWRVVLGAAAAQLLLVPFIAFGVPESDLWRARRDRVRRGEAVDEARLRELFSPEVGRTFVIVFFLTLFAMANYWFTVSWLPEFMSRSMNLSIAKTGKWTLAFVSGSLAGYYLFTMTADRLGRRPAFTIFALLMALGTAMLTVFEGAVRNHPNLVLLFAVTAGIGTGIWSTFGPLYTELFPTRLRTTAGGICMNVSRGIQFVAPSIVLLVGGEKLSAGVALAGVFALLEGAWIWLLPETGGKRLDSD